MTAAIVDTGPLVAFFDRAEQRHHWVAERFDELDAPLLVCEPVLTEAMYLLARYPKAQDAVLQLVQNGALSVAFRIDEHIGEITQIASEIQGHADVAGRRLHRLHGGDPRSTCRADARFRFLDLSKEWPDGVRTSFTRQHRRPRITRAGPPLDVRGLIAAAVRRHMVLAWTKICTRRGAAAARRMIGYIDAANRASLCLHEVFGLRQVGRIVP